MQQYEFQPKYSGHFFRSILVLGLMFTLTAGSAQITYLQNIVVAKDGSGNFTGIQKAINAVRAYSPEHVTITIKKGVYHEKVLIPAWVTNLSVIGESREETIITNSDYSGKFKSVDTIQDRTKFSTFDSYTVYVQGNDVSLENLTIKNEAGRVGQAVALHVDGDRFVIKNCNLNGNQDTLLTANDRSRQYYKDCFIEGTTDFIFGNAAVIFQDCTIRSLTNSYITAASTTQLQQYGYVFMNCKLTANAEATSVYLGRPWRAYARVVFMNSELGKHIRPEGWQNWNKTENEATASYAEYNNSGEGAATGKRVTWSKQLTKKEARRYTIANIFSGWNPVK